MKKRITYLLLLLSLTVFAQDKAKIKDFFWGKNDPYSAVNTIPEKWKNESAVIIYKYENHDYHNYRINVTYTSAIRKKVMLLDEAAVTDYSEFSFLDKVYSDKGYSRKEGANIFGVKIIKPNGSVVEIDVDKESKMVDDEKKIAISNLEVGDIIDYYLFSEEKFKSDGSTGFPQVERVLGESYPILNYKLNFVSENDFFINFNSYNGAPELTEVKAEKSGDRKFELVAKDVVKRESSRWLYPLVELPSYKFQVYFAKSSSDRIWANAFLSDREKDIKKKVLKNEVFDAYDKEFYPEYYYNSAHEDPKKFFKGQKFANEEEKVRALYYYARYLYLIRPIQLKIAQETNLAKEYTYMQTGYNVPFSNDQDFMRYFTTFLKNNKIDYEMIIGTARYNGPISDLLIKDNITPVLKVNTPNPLYIEYFTPFSGIDYLNPDLENTNAYVLRAYGSNTMVDLTEVTLPSSTVKDNVSKTVCNVALNSELTDFKVSREVSSFGHFKADEQSEKMPFYEYVKEDDALYTVDKKYGIPKTKVEMDKKGMKALINKLKENNKEKYTKGISQEYDDTKVEDYTIEILKSGRNGINEPFQIKEDFQIKNDFIKRAGDNYIIEIGKFLTSQVEIDKKEKERKNDVFMPFPRAIENEIIFEIPAGYTVSGIEKLNKNVTNDTGKFTSVATITGNKLTIVTSKEYNHYFEPNSNWSKMIQFLDAAYQFTQEKILLKKA